jgi:hypothetical protein
MIFVVKNNNIISGFFDISEDYQSGDHTNIGYIAENNNFIYCCYGDVTSYAMIKYR